MKKLCSIPLLFLATSCSNNEPAMVMYPSFSSQITLETAEAFARLALDGIVREFPNKPSEVQVDASWARTPRQMHPAFYGSFDWHSSVHGHWMLIRLLHLELLSPQTEEEVRRILNSHLSPGKLRAEAEYFQEKHNRSYERMYGWAWYLRLCAELETWEDPQAKEWREAVRHLENLLVERILDYLPKLSFPVRVGVHRDTAFALTAVGSSAVEALISALDDTSEWTRINAAFALGELDSLAINAVPRLIKCLNDKSHRFVRTVLDSLGSICQNVSPFVMDISQFLLKKEPSWEEVLHSRRWTAQDQIRINAAMALARLGRDAAMAEDILIQALDDPCGHVGAFAMDALRRLDSTSSKQAIMSYLAAQRWDESIREDRLY